MWYFVVFETFGIFDVKYINLVSENNFKKERNKEVEFFCSFT